MSVLNAVLRRCGATMVQRDGRWTAADFGSAQTEAAVCRSGVGLADRSLRETFELHGEPAVLDWALTRLERAWSVRPAPERAIVRCEPEDEAACIAELEEIPGVARLDVTMAHAAIGLIGPRAESVLIAAGIGREVPATVLHEDDDHVEVLVPAAQGPAVWFRLLDAGEPHGISCVGLDALEHLAVSDHLGAASHSG